MPVRLGPSCLCYFDKDLRQVHVGRQCSHGFAQAWVGVDEPVRSILVVEWLVEHLGATPLIVSHSFTRSKTTKGGNEAPPKLSLSEANRDDIASAIVSSVIDVSAARITATMPGFALPA